MPCSTGLPIAFCGSDPAWEVVSRTLAPRGIAVRRYAAAQPRPWAGGRFELLIAELVTGDGDTLEQFRRVNRVRGGVPLLLLYGPDAAAQAIAARAGAAEGVVLCPWLQGMQGEEVAVARFVRALLDASPAFCLRTILKHAVEPTVPTGAAFAIAVVDRLAAGMGLVRKEGERRGGGVYQVAREARTSLRSLEEALRRTRLPPPAVLARFVAVLYTALLACARNRSLEWAAREAGLSPERVRRWRRGLGLPPGLSPEEVVLTALRALAQRCGLPSTRLTAVVRDVAPFLGNRAQAAGA